VKRFLKERNCTGKGLDMARTAEQYVDIQNENLWDFDVLSGVTFMNANRIHPLKQREINEIVYRLKEDIHVEGLIIFGSATEFRCNSRSDIDMFVVRDDNRAELDVDIFDLPSKQDILFNKNAGERLKKILLEHGVLVYERGL
jgi:predicted nucleotidyltransferase